MTKTQKTLILPALALLAVFGGAALGYAQLSSAEMGMGMGGGMMGMHGDKKSGVHGEITAIRGTTLTVKGVNGTTYTVDASDVEVRIFTEGEGFNDVAVSDLKVGDTIGVRGTVDGTSVKATDIMSGTLPKGMRGMGHHGGRGVMGEVTAVDGTTITVKGQDGKSYTVVGGDATVSRVVDGTLGDINVGDRIGVHGTRNGTTVTAKHIMDDVKDRVEDDNDGDGN